MDKRFFTWFMAAVIGLLLMGSPVFADAYSGQTGRYPASVGITGVDADGNKTIYGSAEKEKDFPDAGGFPMYVSGVDNKSYPAYSQSGIIYVLPYAGSTVTIAGIPPISTAAGTTITITSLPPITTAPGTTVTISGTPTVDASGSSVTITSGTLDTVANVTNCTIKGASGAEMTANDSGSGKDYAIVGGLDATQPSPLTVTTGRLNVNADGSSVTETNSSAIASDVSNISGFAHTMSDDTDTIAVYTGGTMSAANNIDGKITACDTTNVTVTGGSFNYGESTATASFTTTNATLATPGAGNLVYVDGFSATTWSTTQVITLKVGSTTIGNWCMGTGFQASFPGVYKGAPDEAVTLELLTAEPVYWNLQYREE